MNEAEKKLVENNIDLVDKLIYKKFFGYIEDDDFRQNALYHLCGAASKYDEDRGEFRPFAYCYVWKKMYNEIQKQQSFGKEKLIKSQITYTYDEEGVEQDILELTQDNNNFYIDIFIKNLIDAFPERERDICIYTIRGYTIKEMCELLNYSKRQIETSQLKIRKAFLRYEPKWSVMLAA